MTSEHEHVKFCKLPPHSPLQNLFNRISWSIFWSRSNPHSSFCDGSPPVVLRPRFFAGHQVQRVGSEAVSPQSAWQCDLFAAFLRSFLPGAHHIDTLVHGVFWCVWVFILRASALPRSSYFLMLIQRGLRRNRTVGNLNHTNICGRL